MISKDLIIALIGMGLIYAVGYLSFWQPLVRQKDAKRGRSIDIEKYVKFRNVAIKDFGPISDAGGAFLSKTSELRISDKSLLAAYLEWDRVTKLRPGEDPYKAWIEAKKNLPQFNKPPTTSH
jgi:hypothetical protein